MDGRGMFAFIEVWARNVAAIAEGRLVSDVMRAESLDRTQAFADRGSGDMHISEFKDYSVMREGIVGDRLRELFRISLEGNTSHPAFQILRELTTTYWAISHEALRALKRAKPPSSCEGPELTDSTLISALLWRHISRARRLSSRGVKTTSVVNMVNIRRRLQPPLPHDYFGNAVTVAKTTVSPTDVESKHLHELARLVSESIEWWTSERIWSYIRALDSTYQAERV